MTSADATSSTIMNAGVRTRLVGLMQDYFKACPEMIPHTLTVLAHAQAIQSAAGGDPCVVTAAAILHDIGVPEALRRHGSAAGSLQELEGPPIARQILETLDAEMNRETQFGPARIDHVCRIVAQHHSAREIDTPEFRCVWDADWLVNFPNQFRALEQDKIRAQIEKIFRTEKGRALAREMFMD